MKIKHTQMRSVSWQVLSKSYHPIYDSTDHYGYIT